MIIRGIDFNFSTLNANDVDRMLSAQKKQQERTKAEGSRYTPDGAGYPAFLRFQCSVFMDYLDEVLGAGACEKLGLDGSNFNECLAVSKDFAEAMAAEKAALSEMLRPAAAQEKKTQETVTAGHLHSVADSKPGALTHQLNVQSFRTIPAPANREQRRAAERSRLSDAKAAVDALKNDPDAMQQLAETALKLYADRHV